ncbi:MAG: hypothetical protein KKC64_13395, partial [Spirochaetes bacterium]|nr:hypothetical protein [Spirochaetota bacterium]
KEKCIATMARLEYGVGMLIMSDENKPALVSEAPQWLAVRKPAGLHCTGATLTDPAAANDHSAETLCSWVFDRWPDCAAVHGHQPGEGGLLHRLDSATSGLVLFARTQVAFTALDQAAAAGLFQKEYAALCAVDGAGSFASGLEGSRPELFAPGQLDVQHWLRLLRSGEAGRLAAVLQNTAVSSIFRAYGKGRRRVACAINSQLSAAVAAKWGSREYRSDILDALAVSARLQPGAIEIDTSNAIFGPADPELIPALLCRVRLTNGFRHQIRAHFTWQGLPLHGDQLYGSTESEVSTGSRLGLHAGLLSFPDPAGGGRLAVVDTGWESFFDSGLLS